MKQLVLITACSYGALAIVLGAFGAHAFKKILSPEKLESFETGVRYQIYAAFFLLICGLNLNMDLVLAQWSFYLMTLGTLLFSGSIYLLAFAGYWNKNLKFLGPVTPLGGLGMISAWILLIFLFLN